jgi:uncharacterized membrane protein (UPF0127 family)
MLARAHVVVLLMALGVAPGACRNGRSGGSPAQTAQTSPRVILHAGPDGRAIPVRVELARTEPERERGLMFRNQMDVDAGMLFLFPRPSPLSFWMKNTLIPLDMIFIDHDRRIVGIVENAAPETETARRVDGDSQYVLEIGGGLSRTWGLRAGSTVEFAGLPPGSESPPN